MGPGHQGFLPSLLLLTPCSAYLSFRSFPRELALLGEAHRRSWLLELLLQKAPCSLLTLPVQAGTFQCPGLQYCNTSNTALVTKLQPDSLIFFQRKISTRYQELNCMQESVLNVFLVLTTGSDLYWDFGVLLHLLVVGDRAVPNSASRARAVMLNPHRCEG